MHNFYLVFPFMGLCFMLLSSISFATVTLSTGKVSSELESKQNIKPCVTVGDPNFLSRMTLWPKNTINHFRS